MAPLDASHMIYYQSAIVTTARSCIISDRARYCWKTDIFSYPLDL